MKLRHVSLSFELNLHNIYDVMSWHGNIFCNTGPLWGESIRRPVMWSFELFFIASLKKSWWTNNPFASAASDLRCLWHHLTRNLWTLLGLVMFEYIVYREVGYNCRVDSRLVPSQWGMALQCNDIAHWLGASVESALNWVGQWLIAYSAPSFSINCWLVISHNSRVNNCLNSMILPWKSCDSPDDVMNSVNDFVLIQTTNC